MITVHMLVPITLKCDSCGDEILINVPVNKVDDYKFILETLNEMEKYGWDFYDDNLYCCDDCVPQLPKDIPTVHATPVDPARLWSLYKCCYCHTPLNSSSVRDGSGNLYHKGCIELAYKNTQYVVIMDKGD